MKNAVCPILLRCQIQARFAQGVDGAFEPHATADALIREQLDHNQRQEVPEAEEEVLERLLGWMDEQLALVQHMAQQSTPQARAAYGEQMGLLLDQELAALLANADAYHAGRDGSDDLVCC